MQQASSRILMSMRTVPMSSLARIGTRHASSIRPAPAIGAASALASGRVSDRSAHPTLQGNTLDHSWSSSVPTRGIREVIGHKNRGVSGKRSGRIFLKSPGVIADDYVPPESLPVPFSRQGFDDLKKEFKSRFQTVLSIYRAKKHDPSFSLVSDSNVLQDIEKTYIDVNTAFALNNVKLLREVLTEKVYSEAKAGLKNRGKERHVWECLGIDSKDVLTVRYFPLEKWHFAQVTVRIKSRQTLQVFNSRGRKLAGDENEVLDVTDVWVFEKMLGKKDSRWRYAGRL